MPSGSPRKYLQGHLTVSCSPRYIKNVSVIDLAALPQVSRKVIGMDLATRETGTEFADLMCADPQWLREEFDALIAASFGRPPAPPPPAPPRVPPRRVPWHSPSGPRAGHLPARRTVRGSGNGCRRQRSPPA